jgi:hypothetical protein
LHKRKEKGIKTYWYTKEKGKRGKEKWGRNNEQNTNTKFFPINNYYKCKYMKLTG